MTILKRAFYSILCIMLVACANVPIANEDDTKKVKLFEQPLNGMASVYIIRDSLRGQTSVLELSINGITVAKTAPKTFVHFYLKEGRYYIGARGENYSQIVLNAVPGEIYFIRQIVTTGWNDFRTDLVSVSTLEGKEGVLGSSMALKLILDGDLYPINALTPK